MNVKCTSAGCSWINELGSLEKHLETCGLVLMPCPDCDKHLMRREHPSHSAEECPLRPHTCEHCKSKGTYKEMTGGHLDECPDLMVPCPNNGCSVSFKRKEIASHHLECPFETINCPYKDVGCPYTSQRHTMEDHKATSCGHHLDLAMVKLTSCGHHLDLAMVQLNIQEKQIAILCNQQKCTSCVIRIPQFNVLKVNDTAWWSPGFYTHAQGYKFCLAVCANGNGGGKGTHMSVYLCLMKGENDDTLTWPIRYKRTITLLNQLKDDGHRSKSLTLPSDVADIQNSRVLSGERGSGNGYPKFIPHDQLGLQADKQCQYLKDDSLYFRVQVEVLPACKPWLMVTVPSEDA